MSFSKELIIIIIQVTYEIPKGDRSEYSVEDRKGGESFYSRRVRRILVKFQGTVMSGGGML